jgi:hypothetical protein
MSDEKRGPELIQIGIKQVSRFLAIVGLTMILLTGTTAGASSSLPPLASLHEAKFPPSSSSSSDSCSIIQYENTDVPSVFRVDLRGLRISLLGPVGWTCDIVDGDGSGASILLGPTKNFPYGPTGDMELDASANTTDNGANFCPYTRAYKPYVGSCRGHRSRPVGEEVKYLFGGATSKSMVVLIADPAGDRTPSSGTATEPTITVLAVSGDGTAHDLVCTIGTKLSSLCATDATQFAAAVHRLG